MGAKGRIQVKSVCFLFIIVVCNLLMLAQIVSAQEKGRVFRESFDTADNWEVIHGDWEVEDGAYYQRSAAGPDYRYALVSIPFVPDFVTVDVTPTKRNEYGFASFGFVIKYVDASNWAIIRFGSYGGVSLMSYENGKKKMRALGVFKAKPGRTYKVALAYGQDRIAVLLDGALEYVFRARLAEKHGRLGFFTETSCRFENFEAHAGGNALESYVSEAASDAEVEEAPSFADKPSKSLTGTPELELAFAAYRPALKLPEEYLPSRGGVYLYVRNKGTGSAELQRVLIGGKIAESLPQTVGWYRQRPASLKPGEMGEILIRLSALPIEMAIKLFENPDARPMLPITVEPYGGKALDIQVPIGVEPDPFQINYVGFDPALQRVYIYVQQNVAGDALRLSHVSINGHDLTDQTQFGQKQVNAVTPIVVDLPEPMREGEPAVICVGTEEGAWAGHAARAFPGKFHIQVTLMAEQTRSDAVEDIWRHNATCIGLCGKNKEPLREAKALGMTAFHYGRGGLKALRQFDKPEYPEISGFWLDEMDSLPLRRTFDIIQECERAYAEQDKFIPLQMINLCSSRVPAAVEFYELADASCSAHGFAGGSVGNQFGRVSSLSQREYRLARLPFMPYFRNAEMPVIVDPETKKALGRKPKHRRCLEPKEERWMTYCCLIQGAKSIMHWNYGAWLCEPPSWFSKDQWLIRASLGGVLNHKPHGYEIPEDIADDLRQVWDEIGRINVELQAIDPLVAVSDVSNLAQVVAVAPENLEKTAAEAAALVSGLDSIVLIALNHNINTHWKASAERGIESYPPIDATVELQLPSWLEPDHVFRVRCDGVQKLTPTRTTDCLTFRFPELEVSEIVVITEREGLMESMAATVKELQARLNTGQTSQ